MTSTTALRARIGLLSVASLLAASCAVELEAEPIASVDLALGLTDPPIVISQLYGAGGNTGALFTNDFVELFNRSPSSVTISNWSVQYASATGTGNFASNPIAAINATLAPGQYFLVQLAGGAVGSPLPAPNATGTANMAAGAGKVALVNVATGLTCNGSAGQPCNAAQEAQIVDLVGYGNANYFETAAAPTASAANAVVRKGGGCTDSNNNSADLMLAPPAPRNSATALAPCGVTPPPAPTVSATTPSNGATGIAADSNIQISFSEPVSASGAWYTIACSISGSVSATVSGGPTSYVLDPASDFAAGESCNVAVLGAAITNAGGVAMSADYTFSFAVAAPVVLTAIHDVQGAAHQSSFAGSSVSTRGIVTAVRSNGYYLQDPAPDADDATSEAVFVFTSSAPAGIAVGDDVQVTGPISEFRPGCSSCAPSAAAFDNLTTTEVNRPTVTTVLSHGNPLPAPIVLGAGGRTVPSTVIENDSAANLESGNTFDPSEDGIDFYESLEAMRVQLNDAVVVGPTHLFGTTSKEIYVVSDNGSAASLRTARGGVVVQPGDFNPERIVLANTIQPLLPDADVGDTFPGAIVGVLDYDFANFHLLPTTPVPAVQHNGLARESLSLPAPSAAELRIAAFNVENLDPGDPQSKFDELAGIVVDGLGSPDIVTLEEVQDNDGATNSGTVDATVTFQQLIAAISAAGGPSYDFRSVDPVDLQDGGEPGGNIRVGFLFRSDRGLSFVDRPGAGALTANTVSDVGGAPELQFSPGRIDPTNAAFNNSRKPLAAQFSFNGVELFVIGNHFNSKGGDDPLFGRFQPPVLGSETQRLAQAQIVAGFVDQILAIDADANVVVLGDLNDFEFSAPVSALQAVGLTSLIETLPANERYTYVFEGNSQVLDHVMVSPHALGRVSAFDVMHVNAEFASQASDHDPGVASLSLDAIAPVLSGPGNLTVEATSAAGAIVSFSVSANDETDGALPVSCTPASGTQLALGTTPVSCSATDSAGNVGSTSFSVTVQDTTAPSFAGVPAPITVVAQRPAGATVSYAAPTASDLVSGSVAVSCAPGSGTQFPIGTTTVTCSASDAAGNPAGASFTVTVLPLRLSAAGPSVLFVGLQDSDDQGTQFDLSTELLLDGVPIARGETRCVTGVVRNPNQAKRVAVPLPPFPPVSLQSGGVLALEIATRIGTSPNGTKCSGPGGSHASADGLRMYYDSASRPARLDSVAISDRPTRDLFLHRHGAGLVLGPVAPSGVPPETLDSAALRFSGGNAWRPIGTFSVTVP